MAAGQLSVCEVLVPQGVRAPRLGLRRPERSSESCTSLLSGLGELPSSLWDSFTPSVNQETRRILQALHAHRTSSQSHLAHPRPQCSISVLFSISRVPAAHSRLGSHLLGRGALSACGCGALSHIQPVCAFLLSANWPLPLSLSPLPLLSGS